MGFFPTFISVSTACYFLLPLFVLQFCWFSGKFCLVQWQSIHPALARCWAWFLLQQEDKKCCLQVGMVPYLAPVGWWLLTSQFTSGSFLTQIDSGLLPTNLWRFPCHSVYYQFLPHSSLSLHVPWSFRLLPTSNLAPVRSHLKVRATLWQQSLSEHGSGFWLMQFPYHSASHQFSTSSPLNLHQVAPEPQGGVMLAVTLSVAALMCLYSLPK